MSDPPATDTDRIITLDVIRGIAVMGIFSVNVVAFAMVEAAYFNPPLFGFHSLADRLMWLATFLFIDGKMRSLFSILFGASMLLVIERAEANNRSAARVHFARMAVLLLFGLAHFYLVWVGDILTSYAIVGMFAFAFRKQPLSSLAALSITFYVGAFLWSINDSAAFANAVDVVRSNFGTARQIAAAHNTIAFFEPSRRAIAEDFQAHRSFAALAHWTMIREFWAPWYQLRGLFPETLALMLLGMAGYRSGFLTGAWSDRCYARIAAIALSSGLLYCALLAALVWSGGFTLQVTISALETWMIPAHPVMAIGYASAIVLLVRRRGFITARVAAVGRSAFTNYLGTSILASLVFNGSGLGLYDRLSRAECWLLVPFVWALMLLWSKPWLDHFSNGPFEWAWRSLARGALQPMRKPRSARSPDHA